MDFKKFLEQAESYKVDIKKTLKKIPKKHQALVRGYKIKFQPGNTLKGDNEHIGYVDEEEGTITIAAPWNYGREYTLLHEIGHAVWKYLVDKQSKKKWIDLVKKEKKNMKSSDALNQSPEEIFCMVYACIYTKHPPTTFQNKNWEEFVKKVI